MDRLNQIINRIIEGILIGLMVIMILDVIWQVVTRFILRHPSSFTEELAGFLLIWIGVLGACYALKTRAHLGIDILTYKLKGIKKQFIEVIVYILVIAFALFIMVIGGFRLVKLTLALNQISPALGIKMGYVYSVIPFSGILMVYYSIGFIIGALKNNDTDKYSHQTSIVD